MLCLSGCFYLCFFSYFILSQILFFILRCCRVVCSSSRDEFSSQDTLVSGKQQQLFFEKFFFQFFSYSRCCHLSAETVSFSFHVQRLQNQSEVKFSFSFQNGSIQNDSNKNGLSLIAPLCIHFPADLRRYEIFSIYRFFSYNNFFDFPFNL